jgi:uncharacterized membrane protein
MRTEDRTFAGEPSQNIIHKAFLIEQVCLVLVVQIVLINLLSRFSAHFYNLLPAGLLHMRVSSAFALLSATLALFFTEAGRSRRFHLIAGILAAFTALVGAASLWAPASRIFSQFDTFLDVNQLPQRQGPGLALSLVLLLMGIVILLIRSRESLLSRIADAVASCLALLVLILISICLFEFAQKSEEPTAGLPSFPTLVCFCLLALVIILGFAGQRNRRPDRTDPCSNSRRVAVPPRTWQGAPHQCPIGSGPLHQRNLHIRGNRRLICIAPPARAPDQRNAE